MQSPATRKLKKRSMFVMGCYFVIFLGTMFLVDRLHPSGWYLYFLAALPTVPIIKVFFLTGEYLGTEKDDFKRDLMMRCILWGTGASLSLTLFMGFLRIFGWKGALPPFTEFYVFAIFMIFAKLSYRMFNPLPADE
jgi:hypothetical protein